MISARLLGPIIKISAQGYKEFTVHMSSFHGGLDMVMAMDPREEVTFQMSPNVVRGKMDWGNFKMVAFG